ncbi:sugar phosphate nucleotidyltransferase [Natronorubrum halophilum]|uniref:sugar phosphate nucleotidyltransferase n=1 Tax=Natronorubrum halophilum TaxID=1702106 RepID=UPI0010C1EBE1|nr:sugar phosphate nucleotidyltransferase [Natronorubrum halophilum]
MDIKSAIVLAAGEGQRLRPLTTNRPKPMLSAGPKPILEHVFDELIDAGITDITVIVGYQRNRVQSYFGSTYRNVPLTYVIQDKQLGSGHALLVAESKITEPTVVVYGDQLIDKQIIRDVATHHDSASATLGLVHQSDVTKYGGVLRTDDGSVTEIIENPHDDRNYHLNAGVYVFEPEIVDAIRTTDSHAGEYSLVDGLATLLENGATVQSVVSDGIWVDATYPWDLLEIADDLFETRNGVESQIAPSASVHDDATIIEPIIVEPDCVIGPGAVVGPSVCLGENVTVEANATVRHSVIDADTRIGTNATLIDCVTGRGVHVGPASTVVGGPGDIEVGNRVHRNKQLGAVLADRVRDEGGVTYRPGTIVGADAIIHAGSTVGGTIENDIEVRA